MHQVNQQELDRVAYTLAKDFLLQSGASKGVTPELIEKYLHLSTPRPDTLAALYEHVLESAQSGNMKAGVIGGSIGGVANLGPVLCDFEPPALPLLLAQEIEGFGFALACDFLNGLGYENFSKPDVHVKDIFGGLGLCAEGAGDYEVFRAVGRLARNAGVTPYNADKLFWLVGSGYFYDDPHIGNKGRIGRHKKEFIVVARERLEPMRHAEAPRTS
jgi:hypothetical protein